jgi:hypothetical protein
MQVQSGERNSSGSPYLANCVSRNQLAGGRSRLHTLRLFQKLLFAIDQ